jgi:tetratricopeptide (TPR) repeat protein
MKSDMDAAAGPLVRARHDLARRRPDRALVALEKVTGPELETHEFWELRATALYDLGRWDEAIQAAREGLDREPGDFELLDALALAQLERGRKKQALATIESALAIYPDDADLHAHRALILMRMQPRAFRLASYKKARAAAEEALRLDPGCEAALRIRAMIAVLVRERHAGEYSAELLSLDPEDERAHVIAGSARARRGDVAGGIAHYLEAARLDPSDPQLAWLGRHSRALQAKFAAPLLFAERLTRGNVRFAWILVVIAVIHLHQPLLSVAAFSVWAYMWAVHIYIRRRTGKAPK